MKRNRKLTLLLLLLLGLVFYLTGCSVSEFQRSVYNDDEKIARQADSYNFRTRVGSTTKEKCEIKFGIFYGTDTLWSMEAEGDAEVTIEYNLKTERGSFKVVLIGPDNKVSIIAEGTKDGEKMLKLQKGNSRIKIVGNGSKGEVEIYVKDDKNVKIKSQES